MVILDNKVFQLWIICANTQNLNRDVDFLRICAEIPNNDLYNSLWIRRSLRTIVGFCALTDSSNHNRDVQIIQPSKIKKYFLEYLRTYAEYIGASRYLLIYANNPALDNQNHFKNICVRTQNTSMSQGTCSYTQIIHRWKAKIIL